MLWCVGLRNGSCGLGLVGDGVGRGGRVGRSDEEATGAACERRGVERADSAPARRGSSGEHDQGL